MPDGQAQDILDMYRQFLKERGLNPADYLIPSKSLFGGQGAENIDWAEWVKRGFAPGFIEAYPAYVKEIMKLAGVEGGAPPVPAEVAEDAATALAGETGVAGQIKPPDYAGPGQVQPQEAEKAGQPSEVDWDAFAKLWPEEGQAMVAGAKMLYEQQASVVGFGGEISWPYPTAADAMNAYMEMAFMLQKVTPKVPVPEVADPDVITEEKPIQTEFGGKTWRATQTTQTKGGVTTLTSIRLDEVMDEAGKTFNLVPHAGGLYMYDPVDPKGTLRELIKAEVDKSGRQIITAGAKMGLLTFNKEGNLASVDWDVLKPPETLEEKEEARLRREGLAQDLQLKRFQLEAARAAERLAREDREEARHQATMQRFEGLVASANLQITSGNLEAAGLRRTGEAAMDAFMTAGPTGPRGWAWLLEGMQQQRAADVIDANVVAAQKFRDDLQSYMAETEKRHAASMAAIEGQPVGTGFTNIVTAQPQATEPAMPSAREPRLVTLPGTVGSTPFGGATPPGFGFVGDFLSNEQISQALFDWKMGGEPGEPPRKWWWETPQWQAANVEPSPFTGGSMPSPFAGEGGPPRRQALRVFA